MLLFLLHCYSSSLSSSEHLQLRSRWLESLVILQPVLDIGGTTIAQIVLARRAHIFLELIC